MAFEKLSRRSIRYKKDRKPLLQKPPPRAHQCVALGLKSIAPMLSQLVKPRPARNLLLKDLLQDDATRPALLAKAPEAVLGEPKRGHLTTAQRTWLVDKRLPTHEWKDLGVAGQRDYLQKANASDDSAAPARRCIVLRGIESHCEVLCGTTRYYLREALRCIIRGIM